MYILKFKYLYTCICIEDIHVPAYMPRLRIFTQNAHMHTQPLCLSLPHTHTPTHTRTHTNTQTK